MGLCPIKLIIQIIVFMFIDRVLVLLWIDLITHNRMLYEAYVDNGSMRVCM